jgi:hypothetical protein
MKPKSYTILLRAVEEGCKMGYNRAHKHTDNPPQHQIEDSIVNEVMNAICEVFSFDDENAT